METRNYNEMTKLFNMANKYKYRCECGKSLTIYPMEHKDKKLCSHCGRYVYINKEQQNRYNFKIKMKIKLGKIV